MNEPIRVLHVFGRLDAGGAESRVMDIYRQIDKTKIQFDFVIHTEDECFYSKEVRELGGKIHSLTRFNGKNYFQYKKEWKKLLENNPEYDIIHGHQTTTAFVYLKIAKKMRRSVRIAHARNSNKESLFKYFSSKLSKFFATHLFAVSKEAAISEFGKREIKNKNVFTIPNAINAKKYTFNRKVRNEIREKMGLQNKLIVGHIGRFHPQKNHGFLIDVISSLSEKDDNLSLLLIGEGELEEDIKNKVEKLDLKQNVQFLGCRSDVSDLLQAIDVIIFPSYYEGLPGAILEAQAAGLPCVISDNVTKEVQLTNLVEFKPIEESPKEWAQLALKKGKFTTRENTFEIFLNKGYDIRSVAKFYEYFYSNPYIEYKETKLND